MPEINPALEMMREMTRKRLDEVRKMPWPPDYTQALKPRPFPKNYGETRQIVVDEQGNESFFTL